MHPYFAIRCVFGQEGLSCVEQLLKAFAGRSVANWAALVKHARAGQSTRNTEHL